MRCWLFGGLTKSLNSEIITVHNHLQTGLVRFFEYCINRMGIGSAILQNRAVQIETVNCWLMKERNYPHGYRLRHNLTFFDWPANDVDTAGVRFKFTRTIIIAVRHGGFRRYINTTNMSPTLWYNWYQKDFGWRKSFRPVNHRWPPFCRRIQPVRPNITNIIVMLVDIGFGKHTTVHTGAMLIAI